VTSDAEALATFRAAVGPEHFAEVQAGAEPRRIVAGEPPDSYTDHPEPPLPTAEETAEIDRLAALAEGLRNDGDHPEIARLVALAKEIR
jgi:hypothetical protein